MFRCLLGMVAFQAKLRRGQFIMEFFFPFALLERLEPETGLFKAP